jgi:hypothetical protein
MAETRFEDTRGDVREGINAIGVRFKILPVTPEKILQALDEKRRE